MTPPDDPLDRLVLERLLEDLGDEATLRDLVRTYLDDTPEILLRLRAALAEGRAPEFTLAAHTLKSTSVIFGARRLAMHARELEALGRAGRLPAAERLGRLEEECDRVAAALRSWRSRQAALDEPI